MKTIHKTESRVLCIPANCRFWCLHESFSRLQRIFRTTATSTSTIVPVQLLRSYIFCPFYENIFRILTRTTNAGYTYSNEPRESSAITSQWYSARGAVGGGLNNNPNLPSTPNGTRVAFLNCELYTRVSMGRYELRYRFFRKITIVFYKINAISRVRARSRIRPTVKHPSKRNFFLANTASKSRPVIKLRVRSTVCSKYPIIRTRT